MIGHHVIMGNHAHLVLETTEEGERDNEDNNETLVRDGPAKGVKVERGKTSYCRYLTSTSS